MVNKRIYVIAGVVFVLLSYVVLSLPHDVLPLNPKEAYVDKVKSLEFNFLIPFTGGSGPSGFYFSALFILLAWIIACISLLGVILKHKNNLFWRFSLFWSRIQYYFLDGIFARSGIW